MKKEGFGGLFNSQDGKINIMLLFSIVLIFVLSMFFVNAAITITQSSPINNSINSSRTINFTFTAVSNGDAGEQIINCSIWTNITGTWALAIVNGSNITQGILYNSSTTLSLLNVTFTRDSLFSWAVQCYNISGQYNSSLNRTLTIDATPPRLTAVTPNASLKIGAVWSVDALGNFTDFPITFRVNVSDNNTFSVWYILNASRTDLPTWVAGTSIGQLENASGGGTNNVSMIQELGGDIANGVMMGYVANVSLNFTSPWRGPGPHSVVFCAKDRANTTACTGSFDFVIMGVNVTEIENIFTNIPQGTGAGAANFGGLNITYGNGTEIASGSFMNPISGAGNINSSFTFIFNFSQNAIVSIVGASINEGALGNASNTRVNSTPTTEVRQQLGTGYTSNMAWADIASFIPTSVSYLYGIIQIGGTTYSKKMYCNGTTMSAPNCHTISQCSGTVFGILNYTGIIPTSDACWLESGLINNISLSAGYTYIFVSHFSGAVGGDDRGPPNATFFSPSNDQFAQGTNTSVATSRLINFTVDDTDSTGLNLSMNNSINVTITLGGGQVALFSYTNGSSSGTNLTCTSADALFPQNSTRITCNVTYFFASNGTYLINVTGRDTSNNSNPMNTTTSFTRLTLDNIPPIFVYYNFTANASFNVTGFNNGTVFTLGLGDGISSAQGRTIYGVANWTDNLTQVLQGRLQFFNESSRSWRTMNQTVNDTNSYRAFQYENWVNLSFAIPSGHNEFEGQNVSFRIIANDTVGNVNNSNNVRNFTIQINDTTKPTLLVSSVGGNADLNGTNISTTTPAVMWNATESNKLRYIAVQIDGSVDAGCNKFVNYTGNVETKRNGSITVSSDAGCPLANGTRVVRLTAEDSWGNSELYIYSFTVQSGVNPTITLSGLDSTGNGSSSASPPDNQSIITSNTGINFSAIVGGSSPLKNMSFTNSCNSSLQAFTNNTAITPFRSCAGSTGNRTVTVTAIDFAGNSITNLFQFLVDDVAPSLSVNAPTNGFSGGNNITINLSAKDDVSNISMFGYYLDRTTSLVYLNSSLSIGQPGTNFTNVFSLNFTVGTHTIKFTAADAIGTVTNNTVNSSIVTFTVQGPVDFGSLNNVLSRYFNGTPNSNTLANITAVNISILDPNGLYINITNTTETANQTFQIQFDTNTSTKIYFTSINGSAANWDKINITPVLNATSGFSFVNNLIQNFTNTVLASVFFNTSINEFLPDNNSYYGVVYFPLNISGITATAQEFWWIPNPNAPTLARTNISQCTSAFTRTSTTPCWNYTAGGKTIVQVPHFSVVQAVNDSSAPTINVTIPIGNQTVSKFVPNITVSNDAVSCNYQTNSSAPSNVTMTLSNNICLGTAVSLKNLNAVIGYNITFWVTDRAGNTNQYLWLLNTSDTTASNSPNSSTISTSVSSSTATVTISGINESVNATISYGTDIGTLSSTAMETDFDTSQAVSLTSLTANKLYYFNVSICDFNGNCAVNGTFNFTTSAAAAAAAAASTTSSSSGGGGAVTTPAVAVAASASRQWDTLTAGTSGVLTINKDEIAVTGVTIAVQNTVTSPSLTVASLESNPVATAAAAKVYQYLQITKSNIADSDASKITINFKVPKSWLTSNGVKEDDVVLYRYSGDNWNALLTTKTGEDADNYMYQSSTPGFSAFAIGSKEAAPAVTPPAPEVPAAPGPQPTPTPEQPTPAPTAAPAAPTGISSTTIAWIVVLIIVVVAAIGYFMWQRRKG